MQVSTLSIGFIILNMVLGLCIPTVLAIFFKKKYKLHIFDKKVAPNVYVDFASNNYLDQDNNIIEKPDFITNAESKKEEEKKDDEVKIERPKVDKKIKVKKEDLDDK